jgi:hypothetical protein
MSKENLYVVNAKYEEFQMDHFIKAETMEAAIELFKEISWEAVGHNDYNPTIRLAAPGDEAFDLTEIECNFISYEKYMEECGGN